MKIMKKRYKIRDEMSIKNTLDNAMRFYYLRKTCYRNVTI